MDRLESAAWPLAAGVLCVFVLAVVLKDAAWQVGFAAVAASVAGAALAASPAVGAAVGLAGWAFVTGFDVGKAGELSFTADDLLRAAVLVLLGGVGGVAGRWMADSAGRVSGRRGSDLAARPANEAHRVPEQRRGRVADAPVPFAEPAAERTGRVRPGGDRAADPVGGEEDPALRGEGQVDRPAEWSGT
ncbi:hypothetical protein [Actinomadura roseirufa]|uniref:hypothetical protein n=1 Tax=Actinomadura roseirufa TaxID=2094049 RepID=UPI001041B5CA|nr:hypothetical protein [Actinomadura roseirufa]